MKLSLSKEEADWLKSLVFKAWGTQFDEDDIEGKGPNRNELAYAIYLKLKIILDKDKLNKKIKAL